jgi:hypothetical protein
MGVLALVSATLPISYEVALTPHNPEIGDPPLFTPHCFIPFCGPRAIFLFLLPTYFEETC